VSDQGAIALTDRREVVAVLRLIASATTGLVYGEAIDPDTEQRHRFSGWAGLEAAVEAVIEAALARPVADTAEGPPPTPGWTQRGSRTQAPDVVKEADAEE